MTMSLCVRGVLCDDIRREDNGKLIVIGVYDQSLVLDQMPSNFPLSLWIHGDGFPLGKTRFEMVLKFPGGFSMTAKGEMAVADPNGKASMLFVGFGVELRDVGQIVGSLKLGEEPSFDFLRLNVIFANAPATKREDDSSE